MLKAEIDRKTGKGVIRAKGELPEMLSDVAVLLSGLYRQLQGAEPMLAQAFRHGLTGMVNDPAGPVWNGTGDHAGFAIKK